LKLDINYLLPPKGFFSCNTQKALDPEIEGFRFYKW